MSGEQGREACNYCATQLSETYTMSSGKKYHLSCFVMSTKFVLNSAKKTKCEGCNESGISHKHTSGRGCGHIMCTDCAIECCGSAKKCKQCIKEGKEYDAAERSRKFSKVQDILEKIYFYTIIPVFVVTLLVYPLFIRPITPSEGFGWLFLRVLEGTAVGAATTWIWPLTGLCLIASSLVRFTMLFMHV